MRSACSGVTSLYHALRIDECNRTAGTNAEAMTLRADHEPFGPREVQFLQPPLSVLPRGLALRRCRAIWSSTKKEVAADSANAVRDGGGLGRGAVFRAHKTSTHRPVAPDGPIQAHARVCRHPLQWLAGPNERAHRAGRTEPRASRGLSAAAFETCGSGRTDAGVHALAQVAHADLAATLPPATLLSRANNLLPHDINIVAAERVPARFHARHSAVARSYVYQIALRRTAFAKPYVWWVRDTSGCRAS